MLLPSIRVSKMFFPKGILKGGIKGGLKVLKERNPKILREVLQNTATGSITAGIGGYRGNRYAKDRWDELTPQQKQKYIVAYGADAEEKFKNKQTIQGSVSGFIDGFGLATMAKGVPKLGKNIKEKGLIKGVKAHLSNIEGVEKKSKGLAREFLVPMIRDSMIMYGVPQVYGEWSRIKTRRQGDTNLKG